MIIYLNGTSSAGKSSIAKELQLKTPVPFFYFSIDTLLYSLSQPVLEALQGKRPSISKLDWKAIFHAYFECVATLHRSGNAVIADCPVYQEGLLRLFEGSLGDIKEKLVVGIRCPIEILRSRERSRGDRVEGLAEQQFESIHKFLNYDLMVDSDLHPPEVHAASILERTGL